MHAVVYGGHGGSQTNRVLTAGRDGEITANLPPGSYWIAFSYKDTATITNRGHEPFLIRSGKSTSLPPIMPDKYAIQAADAAPQR